jgi:UDP-N-acetylmuramoyl-L-alanyl-D-glutamate--2,6-diaminopimelate ligase
MKLQSLIGPEVVALTSAGDIEITGLTADSRRVRPGFLFAALAGSKTDGAKFASDALARGSVAILLKQGTSVAIPSEVPILQAAEPRRALALLAARYYALQPATIVAATGTSGKTSVAEFARQLFAAQGRTAASLGTIGIVKPTGITYGSLTTPDPVTLHETLAELAHEGITHLAIEASSHGLDQYRLDGVKLAAAAFTNLGRDHLDYHPTVAAYLAAKMRLFTELLQPGRPVVINADGARASDVIAACRARGLRILTTGVAGESLTIAALTRAGFEQRITIRHTNNDIIVRFPLLGRYQVENALVAAGLAIACGENPSATIRAIECLEGVKGRLEIVARFRSGLVVVDYAHKPEALQAALEALRPFASGRLICVFGCGGDRDKGKRAMMGRIAIKLADVVIVTDDNPRSEKPELIRAQILAAAPGAREIGDRDEAIRSAVAMLGPGDVLLVAGKGHETGQIIGSTVVPFSDHEAIALAIGKA